MKTCGDSGGRRTNGKPCGTTKGLNADNGRCRYHDPLNPPVVVGPGVIAAIAADRARTKNTTRTPDWASHSHWPPERRQYEAERGMVLVEGALDRLREDLGAKMFLYETTAEMEPLLLVISALTALEDLADDVRRGRRLSNRELKRLFNPLPA